MLIRLQKRLEFTRAFKYRRFTMIWIGQTISNLGDGIFQIALAWQVLLMTHSATAMGLLLIASMVPRLVFALIGGVAADRLPRRMIILWSDGGRGVIVLLISILGFAHLLQFWHLVIEALIFGVVDGFFNPAILAITPDLVEKDDLSSANALNSFGQSVTQLLGPMFGAGLIALATPMGAFLANGVSFFLSVTFLASVAIPERHVSTSTEEEQADEETKEEKPGGFRGVVADLQEGLVYVRSLPWIWVTILNAAINNIGFMATLAVAMPKLVADTYGQGAWLLGLIGATGPIGAFIALPLIGVAQRIKRRGLLAYLSLTLPCIGIIIFGLPFPRADAPFIAPVASAMVGFGLTFFNTIYFTILQEKIPSDKLGRVISLDALGSFAAIPIGEAIGGVMADRLGPAIVFLIFGTFSLFNVLVPLLVRDVREME